MRIHLPLLCTISLILTSVLAGCGTIGNPTSVNTPSRSGPAPAASAVAEQVDGVAPNRKQEVQFSEAMDPSTTNNQTFTVADSSGKAVTGAVSYNPDFNLATFLPNQPL